MASPRASPSAGVRENRDAARVSLGGEHRERAGEEVVARRLRSFFAVLAPGCSPTTPQRSTVDQVVVDERCHVDELDGDSRREWGRRVELGGEEGESRTKSLPARGQCTRHRPRRRGPGTARRPRRAPLRRSTRYSSSPDAARTTSRALIWLHSDMERDGSAAEKLVPDALEPRPLSSARTDPRGRESDARSPGDTCKPPRPGSTRPANGTSTSNQSRKNGRRMPRGRVISRTATLPPGRSTRAQLAQPALEILEVADAEAHGRRVEIGVREREGERVTLNPLDRS